MKTAIEILRKYAGDTITVNGLSERYFLMAMEEYAAQFKQTGTNTLVSGSFICDHCDKPFDNPQNEVTLDYDCYKALISK